MTNKRSDVLYIGVTNFLARRIYGHKKSLCDGFAKKHKLKILVYYEMLSDVEKSYKEKRF
ncbi:MAG: GIY-YIG nuclease family protein [Endomicrobium sp.]|nr:GIY-YIG nuclease family protein [Endomicrobium sp.]